MKIQIARKFKKLASTLVTVLVICAILSLSISYYLSLVEQQSVLSTRSQSWNLAMTVTEAGLEEGLQQINSNSGNMAADGWYFDGALYWRSNTMADNNSYTVNVDFSTPNNPIIIARAFVKTAVQNTLFGALGGTPDSGAKKSVTRAIRVRASRGSLFLNALVAKDYIDLNGNGISTDSYDSQDPGKSTNGKYDATKAGDSGDIAANAGIVNALSVGNANIYGHARVGPGGTEDIGANGKIGEHSWQAVHTSGTETGWFSTDANFTFPTTDFPYTSTGPGIITSAAAGDVVTTSYSTNSSATTSSTYPNPVPAGGVTTNSTPVTVTPWSALPSPVPAGTVTNGPFSTNSVAWAPGATFTNTAVWKTYPAYPAPGTYLGVVTTNWNGSSIKEYVYNHITGYTLSYRTYTYPVTTYGYNLTAVTSTTVTNHYDHILNAATSYYMDTLVGSTYVAGADVKLIVANGIDLTQPFVIPTAGAIQVWTGGTSLSMSGNSGANGSGNAAAFILYAAPSVTSFHISGNGQFTGVLVLPGVDVTLNGSGSGDQDFNGSIMAKSVTLTGHFNFHYDEALRRMPNSGRYLVKTWDEIP